MLEVDWKYFEKSFPKAVEFLQEADRREELFNVFLDAKNIESYREDIIRLLSHPACQQLWFVARLKKISGERVDIDELLKEARR